MGKITLTLTITKILEQTTGQEHNYEKLINTMQNKSNYNMPYEIL